MLPRESRSILVFITVSPYCVDDELTFPRFPGLPGGEFHATSFFVVALSKDAKSKHGAYIHGGGEEDAEVFGFEPLDDVFFTINVQV